MKFLFNGWTLFEKTWITTFTLIEFYLFYAWNDTIIGLITMLTGIWCVVLVARGKRSNYIVGIPNVILYGWIAYSSTQRFHGEVMLNWLYFLPIQFYGWYAWTKNSKRNDSNSVIMRRMKLSNAILVISLSFISVVLYGYFLKGIPYQVQPWIDSASTIFSVIAMILMVMRYAEQWILWIIVDIVSVIMWAAVLTTKPEAASMLLMWVAYLVNACYGYWNWVRMSK